MRISYLIVLHIINLFFLVSLGVISVAMISNPAAGSPSPFNPVNMGIISFLFLLLVVDYIIQMKKKQWIVLLIGSILYIAVFIFIMLVAYPFLYDVFNY